MPLPSLGVGMDTLDIYRLAEIGTFILSMAAILYRMGVMTSRFEQIGLQQAAEIKELKVNVKELSGVLVTLAQTNGRIDRMEERQLAQGKRVDETVSRLNSVIDRALRSVEAQSSHPSRQPELDLNAP